MLKYALDGPMMLCIPFSQKVGEIYVYPKRTTRVKIRTVLGTYITKNAEHFVYVHRVWNKLILSCTSGNNSS